MSSNRKPQKILKSVLAKLKQKKGQTLLYLGTENASGGPLLGLKCQQVT
jgi:hypothetical protein